MKHLQKIYTTLLVCLLVVSVFTLTGCRTGSFAKPDLARLAFWKKDGEALAAKSVPPPPARHFDPAPLEGNRNEAMDQPSEIVNLDGGNLEKRFNNNINEALTEIQSAANDPIPKPYSSDIKFTGNEFKPPSFAANPGNSSSPLSGFKKAGAGPSGNMLSAAQEEFQAAMDSPAESTSDGLAAAAGASNEFSQDWNRDIKLPAGLSQSTNRNDPSQPSDNNFALPGIASQAGSSAMANGSSGSGELELVQAQVAEAKQQIERLKMQVEDAKLKAAATLPIGQLSIQQPSTSAPDRIAQLQMPGFNSAYANPGSNGLQPTNVLRSNNQPLLPNPNQPLAPQSQPGNFSPNYPATPHGGFVPRGDVSNSNSSTSPNVNNVAAQTGFESYANGSNVMTAGSQPQESDSASRIQNYVSEVDIPDSILKGTGSYAPGSVNALRK